MIHPLLLMGVTLLVIYIAIHQYKFWSLAYKRAKIIKSECVFRIIKRDDYHIKLECIMCGRIDTFYNPEAKDV